MYKPKLKFGDDSSVEVLADQSVKGDRVSSVRSGEVGGRMRQDAQQAIGARTAEGTHLLSTQVRAV